MSFEAVFRALIAEVLDMPDSRWRIVASIRSFDLRLGEQFKSLFAGRPPSTKYVDPAFPNVRHIHVPRWSDAELAQVLEKAPIIATAIKGAGDRLRDLAHVPFTVRRAGPREKRSAVCEPILVSLNLSLSCSRCPPSPSPSSTVCAGRSSCSSSLARWPPRSVHVRFFNNNQIDYN